MDTNITSKVLETINYAESLAKQGIEFTKEQAPLVVQEFLTWEFLKNGLNCTITGIVCIVLIYFALKFWKKMYSFGCSDDGVFQANNVSPAILFNVIALAVAAILLANVCYPSGLNAVKVKVAPRVYLIEWAAKQVK